MCDIDPITAEQAQAQDPNAVAAWPEPQPPAQYYTGGPDYLLADSADGWPYEWCPELGQWDAM